MSSASIQPYFAVPSRLFAMTKRRRAARNILLCGLVLSIIASTSLLPFRSSHGNDDIAAASIHQHKELSARTSRREQRLVQYSSKRTISTEDFYTIKSSLPTQSNSSARCSAPDLPLYSEFIRGNRPAVIPADVCSRQRPNWLRVSQSRVYLRSEFAAANCSVQPVLRVTDQSSRFGSAQPISNGSELPSVGFRATCKSPDGRNHTSVYYGIRRMQPPAAQGAAGKRDNIIVLGLDSLSRLESLRSLGKASRLLRSRLGALSLLQYNIMGDGTPAALVPILTGVREEEMPEARRGFTAARPLDETMRFIFHRLRELGYLTLYGEEGNSFGTFQLRFLGFKDEPADFYLRPVLLQQEALQTQDICIGDEISSGRMLNAVKDLFTMYPDRPKFTFTFFAHLSHESKDLTPMDSELTKFLDWFVAERLISNTTLILMSDHGQRLGPLRNSMQGKLEESLPLMTFALSDQLTARLSSARQTLMINQNRLTAPTDIHQTLLSIAGATRASGSASKFKSYSLIDEAVPERRSCSDAGIPTHWCSCLSATRLDMPETHQLAVRAAQFAVRQVNLVTRDFRSLCAELQLEGISEADISLATKDLAQRHRSVKGGFAVSSANEAVRASGYVTARFVTSPNQGMYESTVQFSLDRSRSVFELNFVQLGESSRINKYGRHADCVVERAPHLRKFCYCKNSL